MESLGIPISVIFSSLGGLGVFVFMVERSYVREKLKEQKEDLSKFKVETRNNFEKVKEEEKKLSVDELNSLRSYVKECIDNVMNSKEFRTEIKDTIKDAMLHFERNRSAAENGLVDIFLKEIKDLNNKIDKMK